MLQWLRFGVVVLRQVVRFRLSVNVSDARASHFALLAVVLLTSKSCPARPGIWFYVLGVWDGISEMLLL